uniref:Uncharacterized protein n=1 Tax=Anguilla anguilla TaxID=7936 RepID=A0A0E9RUU2_ANGAN
MTVQLIFREILPKVCFGYVQVNFYTGSIFRQLYCVYVTVNKYLVTYRLYSF